MDNAVIETTAEKKQAEVEAQLAKEQAERKRVEDAKRAEEEAKAKAKAELEQADDKVKLAIFVQGLRELYKSIPKLSDSKLEKQIQDKITEISGLCK